MSKAIQYDNNWQEILVKLQERSKELKALHSASQVLYNGKNGIEESLQKLLPAILSGFRNPDKLFARIVYKKREYYFPSFYVNPPLISAEFVTGKGGKGKLEISSRKILPQGAEYFSEEEKKLATFLADMLKAYFENKEAEEALRQSEQRFRLLFDTMKDAFALYEIIIDNEGNPTDYRILEVNAAFERAFGLGKKAHSVFPKPDNEWLEACACAALTGKASTFEKSLSIDDKHYSISVFSPCHGQFAVIFSDITERKTMEAKVLERESRLRLITDNMLDIVIQTDARGFIQYISPSVTTILKEDVDRLQNTRLPLLVHPFHRSLLEEALRNVFFQKKPEKIEVRCRHRNGHYVWVEAIVNAFYNNENKISGTIFSCREITDIKVAEKKVHFLSIYDSLTGLYNRKYFDQERARLEDQIYNPVGIIVCDIDGLKFHNDSFGHKAGDKVLIKAATLIQSCFDNKDIVARIGGDEFGIIITRTSHTAVQAACSRIKEAVAKYNASEKPLFPLSLSIGFAVREDRKQQSLDKLYKRADDKMYREKLHHQQSTRSGIPQVLKKALAARDFITEGHADRMQDIVAAMAEKLGFAEDTIGDLRLFAQFHDIGKVGIPDRILFKPGLLNEEEKEEMKRHSEIGHRIALSAPDLAPIADWILKHHEWWNGQGYPFGLKGDKIPLECRLLTIADAYDTMTSRRPYRAPISHAKAEEEIVRCAGTQFDPQLVKIFLDLPKKIKTGKTTTA